MPSTLLRAASRLTTPFLPDDYLTLVNPLWSTRELRGRVEAVVPETADAATVVVRPARGWPAHQAGQYVRIGVDIDGVRHSRTYSLTSPMQRADGRFTFTVKAIPDGVVSNHLVRATKPGDVLVLEPPQGEFVLPDRRPAKVLFLTGGSGITPVMGMLRSHRLADVVHILGAPTRSAVVFGAEVRSMQSPSYRLHEFHDDVSGMFTFDQLDEICPDWREREVWVCGPGPLMDAAEVHWKDAGISERLRLERFRPRLLADAGEGGEVVFAKSGTTVAAAGSTAILDAGEAAGVLMPSGCRMGICYTCVLPLKAGRVRDLRTGEVHGEEGDLVQTCISAAAGPVELDL
ncbi:MAG: stearoyl-CoA 9-desaturase [Frankiales bacterium]|nr:stearoyl-CoA 9-desaturase [Frankiales bacterium]